MFVNEDQHQISPGATNCEPESQDTPLEIINEWCDQKGHGDVVQNFEKAIKTQKLQLDNLSFRLFAEYLRSIASYFFNIDVVDICGSKCSGIDG